MLVRLLYIDAPTTGQNHFYCEYDIFQIKQAFFEINQKSAGSRASPCFFNAWQYFKKIHDTSQAGPVVHFKKFTACFFTVILLKYITVAVNSGRKVHN